jgi:hypothetical protein
MVIFTEKSRSGERLFHNRLSVLFLLRNSQETVAWVFLDDAVFWKIYWFTFSVLLYLCEEVDCLWLAAAKGDFSFVQVVCDALRVGVLVSHWLYTSY